MVHFLVHTPQVVISGKLNSSWEDKFLPLRFNFLTLVCNVFLYEGSFCSRWVNQTGIRAQRKQADYFFFLLFLLCLSKILFVKCTHKFKPTTTLFSQIVSFNPHFYSVIIDDNTCSISPVELIIYGKRKHFTGCKVEFFYYIFIIQNEFCFP